MARRGLGASGFHNEDQFQQLQALDDAIAWRRAAGLILALTTVNGK